MHDHTIAMAIGACWAALGGLWRPGALALAMSWLIGEAIARATGNGLPILLYRMLDPIVIYIIWRWRSSRLDWFMLVGFAFAWATYTIQDGWLQWWILFWIALAQMVLAGPWPVMQRAMPRVSHGPLRTRNRA